MLVTVPTMDLVDGWDDETVQDAVDALQDMVLWEMSPQRWEHVNELMGLIDVAFRARDVGALRAAVLELEAGGVIRLGRIGSKVETKIPPPVFERRNTLVHTLTSEHRDPPEDGRDSSRPG
ncbi:hypothetical protein GCM10010532_007480 [Dactylosporangium siamense]|uniref:CATRA-Associated Small Protein domain-containing protein n=2 Tax=Dactylosporangium siamense TaxID=685454 RepID=A0A919PFH0_9ACTN|nr:hypothetical protein Dsi01nite_006600 [Dactylosporangium siamense]